MKEQYKEECFKEALKMQIVSVEMILNHFKQINDYHMIDEDVLEKDFNKTVLDLELSLATLSILLRKMSENHLAYIPDDMRKDINSLIHSNRFDYEDGKIVVYSRNGAENVDMEAILTFAKQLI